MLLFAGLELVSIPTYILLALKRTDARGQEASLKYFFLSLVASAVFLYALVCLYGMGGSTDLQAIAARIRSEATGRTVQTLLPLAAGLAIVGAAFRLAAVPMHFYAPDVYEGTSPGNAALLSTLPKLAGIVILARLVALLSPAASPDLLWRIMVMLAAVTMTVGNVMALGQRNLRRLLACSSIAHAGYLLVGVAVAASGSETATVAGGFSATLFYLATYAVATIGLFGGIAYLGHRWPEWTSGGGPPPPFSHTRNVLRYIRKRRILAVPVLAHALQSMPTWGTCALQQATQGTCRPTCKGNLTCSSCQRNLYQSSRGNLDRQSRT